ncbi:AI-2E family transporter [Magnetospirillum sp. SS-4]|uniref:AI-2E family transporter n=1 Tax=Magnetospirillum sp. SS-4 TaxID=2681465 RepID=UPI00138536E1|nr:AI-2E family transporter [Magnetospirillum sp. SS-4]CAA7613692.1 Permease [Magnetospirillum sp. SS-4]
MMLDRRMQPAMTPAQRIRFWAFCALLFLVALYLLRGVLLPFVAGMAIAYFLDPQADRLERLGLSRVWATGLITLAFFSVFGVLLFLLIPVLEQQVSTFVQRLPGYVATLNERVRPLLKDIYDHLTPAEVEKLQGSLGAYAGTVAGWGLDLLKQVLTGGIAVFGILSLLFITPVVTFYLLRDWDRMTATIDGWLPRHHADTIREELREVDRTLAGFVRGQATVCIAMATFYGIGLTLTGLDLGLMIGIGTGLGAFVPYVGMLIGLMASVGLAIAQGGEPFLLGGVAVVFILGNILEGNILTPNLVGDRVGLHPVWIIFSLLSGAALFGFVGVLLAVPVASVVGVATRFAMGRYRASSLYTGSGEPDGQP